VGYTLVSNYAHVCRFSARDQVDVDFEVVLATSVPGPQMRINLMAFCGALPLPQPTFPICLPLSVTFSSIAQKSY